jgi:formylglycine-generating enzyme required for sulfatase activity
MGADLSLESGDSDEAPQHQVTISRPFYLGIYEVTQDEWTRVMGGANPSYSKGQNLPVEHVSWNDASSFVQKLNQKEGTEKYRLPTEAEWEYSARAGTKSAYFFGDDEGSLGTYVWFDGNGGGKTRPVGGKSTNPWGLTTSTVMSGNGSRIFTETTRAPRRLILKVPRRALTA